MKKYTMWYLVASLLPVAIIYFAHAEPQKTLPAGHTEQEAIQHYYGVGR